MDNYKDLKISEHFLDRCVERAPWFTTARKKKDGGGFMLKIPELCEAIKASEEIKRPKTITTLLKYGHKTKYYHFNKDTMKHQVIFVVEDNQLITLYLYRYSWAAKL